ncbi:hypothetical protein BCF33_0131 [Hasllibacter halocynthiae]|uniref:Uncharacterized protein n=1 Tax=Hasllibacter halocynthiae TaxID=595589 RepID=A0A2T0X6F9_9RHOB|nr:hypothetical protein [Hasllibacter halocynthiae]PRY94540.1 hypothetical protein BCF33_0131 [Hasllibacter halocynthiae]
MRLLAALFLVALPAAAKAEPGALAWIRAGSSPADEVVKAGIWHPLGGTVLAIDPLTLLGSVHDPIPVPDRPARGVFGLRNLESGARTSAMMLVWSDAAPVGGEDLSTIGVDTGLAAFATPKDVEGLERHADDQGTSTPRRSRRSTPGRSSSTCPGRRPSPFRAAAGVTAAIRWPA